MITNLISCRDLLLDRSNLNGLIRTLPLLEGKSYSRKKPFFIDDTRLCASQKSLFDTYLGSTYVDPVDINLFELSDAIVCGQGTVFVSSGSIILDSAAEFIAQGLAPDGSHFDGNAIRLNSGLKNEKLDGISVLVKRPWYKNYGHWLVDLMPILPAIRSRDIAIDNIIFGEVHDGNLRMIMKDVARSLYPEAKVVFVPDNNAILCDRLYFIQPVHVPPLFKHPAALDLSVAWMKNLYSVDNDERTGRFYISRDKTNSRKVVNEQELSRFLSAKGFDIVYPEELSISEQIEVFSKSDIVIGVKGAGLTNCMFGKRGAHVLVLSPSKFVDPFFWDVASYSNMEYSEIYCRDTQDTSVVGISGTSIEVDIKCVENFMLRFERSSHHSISSSSASESNSLL